MVVNDAAGDECRIAILEDNHLEELYAERSTNATNVGNIYKGRVVNVEPAIQAAFIDYGEGANGFLHISDLHPRYFPGKERTERVGRKIPRRERPPIQEALRRGDELLVQVLKEGIGTKGPTLTSYLSIPGRLLVMMPEMDRVGVSRKMEDEDGRREMRRILDSLELPDGFGFILRTAGIGRTKTELKRDVAYLTRLWKVMEKRIKSVGAPCELYTESDLLIRTVRDVLRPGISAIVVDSESAYDRINAFLGVVAPRSAPKVIRYRRSAPIFHAFDIERQIDLIHSREVPLHSGGRLVIDQTEALVAIDVNSGRSRGARDSETNAYQTNCEAVDEICRQLRLRDLGGLIIHDLIDMRAARHRRQIQERFQENLRRDRAKSTILPISEFGLVEMTRQRMRPSMRKSHFVMCPQCSGHGEIKASESVASDVIRHAGYILDQERVRRIQIVCSPRVASVLLSGKRRELVGLEDATGKTVDVRVSDDIPADRIDYYAYDARNADIDVALLPVPKRPSLEDLESDEAKAGDAGGDETTGDRPKSRRRRRRKPGPADATAIALAGGFDDDDDADGADDAPGSTGKKTRSRRRRRGGRRDEETTAATGAGERTAASGDATDDRSEDGADDRGDEAKTGSKRRRRGSRGGRRRRKTEVEVEATTAETPPSVTVTGGNCRIHELARELGRPSREVLARCREDGTVEVKNHMSSVNPEQAAVIRGWFTDDDTAARSVEDATEAAGASAASEGEGDEDAAPRRRRRRRGGRGRSRRDKDATEGDATGTSGASDPSPENDQRDADDEPDTAPAKKSRRRRGRRRRSGSDSEPEVAAESGGNQPEGKQSGSHDEERDEDAPRRTKKKRTRRRSSAAKVTADAPSDDGEAPKPSRSSRTKKAPETEPKPIATPAAETPRPRRTLYGGRRKLTRAAALEAAAESKQ